MAQESKSEYYDWCVRNGLYYGVFAITATHTLTLTFLSAFRPHSAGPLGQDAVELMRLLRPHVYQALQAYRKLETLRASSEAMGTALDRLETGLVAVDRDGRVVLMNERAEVILQGKTGITARQGKLAATDPSQSGRLERMVRSSALTGAGCGTDAGSAMTVQGSETSRPVLVTVTPFCCGHLSVEGQPCALVFLADPARKPAPRAAALRALFELTPAECWLADLLLEGMEMRRAAEHMHVTVGTARFMLKSVFRKTSSHRQSELIRLLSTLPGQVAAARGAPPHA